MKIQKKLTRATYLEWQASLFGACGIALGLGILFEKYLLNIAPFLIIIGIILHGWGMYKIHKRNQ